MGEYVTEIVKLRYYAKLSVITGVDWLDYVNADPAFPDSGSDDNNQA